MCVMAMHPKFSTNRRRSGGCIDATLKVSGMNHHPFLSCYLHVIAVLITELLLDFWEVAVTKRLSRKFFVLVLFCAEIMLKLGARTFILPPPFKLPRTFKSHTYAIKPICIYSIAQDLFTAIFESRKDVKLTKLFKLDHRVVYRGRKADFYYF
jgi:hypothetical protein